MQVLVTFVTTAFALALPLHCSASDVEMQPRLPGPIYTGAVGPMLLFNHCYLDLHRYV